MRFQVAVTLEALYKAVESMCSHGKSVVLYQNLKAECQANLTSVLAKLTSDVQVTHVRHHALRASTNAPWYGWHSGGPQLADGCAMGPVATSCMCVHVLFSAGCYGCIGFSVTDRRCLADALRNDGNALHMTLARSCAPSRSRATLLPTPPTCPFVLQTMVLCGNRTRLWRLESAVLCHSVPLCSSCPWAWQVRGCKRTVMVDTNAAGHSVCPTQQNLIRCIFLFLDRTYVLQTSGLDSIWYAQHAPGCLHGWLR